MVPESLMWLGMGLDWGSVVIFRTRLQGDDVMFSQGPGLDGVLPVSWSVATDSNVGP